MQPQCAIIVQKPREVSPWTIFFWETKTHLAELIVSRGEFAPYHFVSLQVLDLRREVDQSPVYIYFDGEDSTTDEILTALDRGIEHMKERQEQHV